MNIKKLIHLTKKPDLYQPGTAVMWTDPHISKQLLNIHLNEHMDLASRKHTTIARTIQWILDQLQDAPQSILDLGCGPGLYTEKLATLGHQVTGVDFSHNSIEYAKGQAQTKNLNIDYRCMNYLDLDFENQFDLAMMIFTDFGVLNPKERDIVLKNVYRALKPGGLFIFDVLSDADLERKVTPNHWEISKGGFWRKGPFLALSDAFFYPEEKIILYQHAIIDPKDQIQIYRFWTQFFSNQDLDTLLNDYGFENGQYFNDVIPEEDLFSGRHVTFCVCRKE